MVDDELDGILGLTGTDRRRGRQALAHRGKVHDGRHPGEVCMRTRSGEKASSFARASQVPSGKTATSAQ